MATVKAIKYGMKGDDVSNLQTTLKKAGYNIDVDGSFGPQTLAAVKQYQQANGLTVDGMVGPQTSSALFGNTSKPAINTAPDSPVVPDSGDGSGYAPPPTPVISNQDKPPAQPSANTDPPTPVSDSDTTPSVAPNNTPGAGSAAPTDFQYKDFTYEGYKSTGAVNKATEKPFTYDDFSYDAFSYGNYQESETVQQANSALQAILESQPGAYQSKWQGQIDGIIDRILNREKFTYDVNSDALYQQYAEQYQRLGKLAMQDTMGQAAAMTGGYGSSYAQSVGQQAYQGYLSQLNEMIPELYGMALDQYNREGQEMYNQYGLLSDQEQQDYGRYQDSYNQWLAERDYATGRYDSERNFDYEKYSDDRNFAYGAYSDNRNLAYNEYVNAIELAKWQETDAYNKYLNDRNFAYGAYSDNRDLDYDKYLTAIQKAQWEAQFDENAKQNAIGNQQWQQSFDETVKQNAIGNQQWQQSFDESQRQYNSSLAEDQRQFNTSFNESKRQYEEAKASASGGSGGAGSQNAALEHVASMSSAEVVETMQGYSADGDNTGLAAFLDDCVASGRLTEAQADEYYEKYRKGNGHTITDTTVPTRSLSGVGGGSGGQVSYKY